MRRTILILALFLAVAGIGLAAALFLDTTGETLWRGGHFGPAPH